MGNGNGNNGYQQPSMNGNQQNQQPPMNGNGNNGNQQPPMNSNGNNGYQQVPVSGSGNQQPPMNGNNGQVPTANGNNGYNGENSFPQFQIHDWNNGNQMNGYKGEYPEYMNGSVSLIVSFAVLATALFI